MSELPGVPDMIRQNGVVTSVSALTNHSEKQPVQGFQLTSPEKPVKFVMPAVEKIRDFWKLQPSYNSDYEAFIPIQNGCDKFCTFCAVPYTRGREISRPSSEILEELHEIVEKGYKSITLLGQNVNSYGRDRNGAELTFPQLLRSIGEYGMKSGKEFWVYFTSPHPRDMSDEVLEVISKYSCLAKQIHLPLQSGDDKVLIRMNRKHNTDDYKKIIDSIRRLIPDATIFTDIIVGFTGETPEQFENTRLLMESVKFNMAYIAIYSPRPGAASSRWDDDIPMQVKKERLHILTEELTRHTIHYNRNLMGRTVKVLVTGRDRKPGYLSGFTEGRIVVRFQSMESIKPGNFVWLTITSAATYSIEGELVSEKAGLQEIV
jgi:tRNA-2-methylthio-N6-dimethylallyladenosine synthase